MANSAAITPDNQIASFPYSSRKYGCQAYHAHEKNPQVTNDSTTRSRTAGFRHPYVMPARATFRISPTIPCRRKVRGVNPMSCIVQNPTAKAMTIRAARTR